MGYGKKSSIIEQATVEAPTTTAGELELSDSVEKFFVDVADAAFPPVSPPKAAACTFHVVLMGEPRVGKTTFLQAGR